MRLTGADIIVECLLEQGVDTVFGYPGGAILNVYDALYKNRDKINHYLTSHEQGASHAADGYARATGKVGVCMATSGPGATNLVTGIATAYMDSVPIVAITCNVTLPLLGKDSFQEVDINGIAMPVTKHSWIVKDVNDLAQTIRNAFAIARTGRPGPVLVDVPKDVTGAECEYEPVVPDRYLPVKKHPVTDSDIDEVIRMIESSRKPFVMVGGGAVISGASEELKTFVEKIESKFSQITGILKFSHETLPKIPELKFHLSELFSFITPVPFDGANLICAEGRVSLTRNWRKFLNRALLCE